MGDGWMERRKEGRSIQGLCMRMACLCLNWDSKMFLYGTLLEVRHTDPGQGFILGPRARTSV